MSRATTTSNAFPMYRVRSSADHPPRADRDLVVYWMTTSRRVEWNFALQRAADWATELKRPLVVVEVLACGGRWDSDRFHRFTLDGMSDNADLLAGGTTLYYPYVEPKPGAARAFFRALSQLACVMVTDDFPVPLPAVQTVDEQAGARIEKIDGNGLLPTRAAGRAFVTASSFRRFLQKTLHEYMLDAPEPDPLAGRAFPRVKSLPAEISRRWPAVEASLLGGEFDLAGLPINHRVGPVELRGGSMAAQKVWKKFLSKKLGNYADDRNQPEADGASGLSPYLHFGHVSVHQIFRDLIKKENWSPRLMPQKANGRRDGWWQMRPPAEEFLDEIITWREIGLNACTWLANHDRYESLPEWAQATLAKHAADERPDVYTLEEFAAATTHDRLWNAAQMQLVREGRIHNYLRMVWGKKILQWTPSPRQALDVMIELNNRYALDGQDPNSYSGIFWVLGRYDRPWAPERPIFGQIRYMSSENTAKKLRVKQYIERYAPHAGP
jgi:deoxyribodipyrimidine photo-lyase